MRETFTPSMDTTTTLTGRKGYFITRNNLFILSGIICCSLLATGIIVYNLASCDECSATDTIQSVSSCIHSSDHGIITAAVTTHSTGSMSNNAEASNKLPEEINDENRTETPETEVTTVNVRLPKSVVPVSYNLKLIPFLIEDNFTFIGEVKILVRIVEDCKNITLHSYALLIHEVNLFEANMSDVTTESIQIVDKYFDIPKQFYIIETDALLTKGSLYQIHIKYEGSLNNDLQGFYRSSYKVGNETRWLATTQFQPTDCRRAFPAFDEPALKARFTLNIARPSHMISLSNMPKIKTVKFDSIEDYEMDMYAESVPMSTYLVAFVICDFKSLTKRNFTVWARADVIQSAAYALDIGIKILEFWEKFFNVQYPLPKMDMIALPDFSSGAMENFGLITYRETTMLYEEGVSASSNKQRVGIVISHELAHQWFGNLVTPNWWTDLWLNEGFASYMEYVGVDAVEPSWKSMDQFIVTELHNVFSLDALANSHPISIKEVENPDEINEIFDRISYAKGAAIIRMMANFLTDEVFRLGMSKYLTGMQFQSAKQDDLWNYLTNAARDHKIFDEKLSVKEIMDTWTLQTGYPVVKIDRHYDNESFKIKQERFTLRKDSYNSLTKFNETWWIPITYTTSRQKHFNHTKPDIWIRREKEIVMTDPNLKNNDWIIANLQQTGYYRVNYDERNWKLITSYLRNPNHYREIAEANRAQLIDDALNLARAGYLDYRIALDVTKYLENEDEYVPWKAANNALGFLDIMLSKSEDYALFREYYIHLLSRIYDSVGFDDDRNSSLLTVYKRIDILTAACHLGIKHCIDNSIRHYHMWIHEGTPDINNPISPNLKSLVYCMAIKYGGAMEWDFAWERYRKATISSEQELLLLALGCSREPWILKRYLERSLTDTFGIRKQDVFRVFVAVSNSVIGQPIALSFMKENWIEMKKYFGQSMSNLNSILKYSTKRLTDQSELDELRNFAKTHLNETGRSIHQVIERTETNIAWAKKNHKIIADWLAKEVDKLEKNQILF